MKKNMGKIDRGTRVVIAIVIGVLYATGMIPGVLGIVLSVFAVVFLLTSFLGSCPLYLPFGLNTCKTEAKSKNK